MVDKSNAESAYKKARSFYGGHEKSSNKAYIGSNITLLMGPSDDLPLAADNLAAAKQIPVAEAMLTVKGRWNNHMASDQHQLKDVLGGKTPVQAGHMLYNRGKAGGNRAANCGAMACVALFLAKDKFGFSEQDIWLITVRNGNTRGAYLKTFGGASMTFAHSWALLKTDDGRYVVDPWAGVFCAEQEYPSRLKSQFNQWQQQGKRVSVDYGNEYRYWTNANDSAILSLLANDAQRDPPIAGNMLMPR
jgi:hypothetical protein